MGMLYEAKRDVRRAHGGRFERALELQPDSDVALAGWSSADLAEKKPASALARIEAQLAKNPNDATLVMMSGMAYMAVRDLPKAEAAYRRLLELDPNSIDAYSKVGRYLPLAESSGRGQKELRGDGASARVRRRRRKRCSARFCSHQNKSG